MNLHLFLLFFLLVMGFQPPAQAAQLKNSRGQFTEFSKADDLNGVATHTGQAVNLTPDERSWLKQHPSIRAGGDANWAPFDFADENGIHIGIARDYLDLIAEKTGLRFSYRADTWSKLLNDIRNERIDLLGSVYFTQERDRFLSYSHPYFEVLDYFFIRDDLDVQTLDDLRGKRVAVPESYALGSVLKEHYPELEIIAVKSLADAIDAVLEGRAEILYDAYAVLNHALKKESITTIVPFKSTRHLGTSQLHFVTRDDQPMLSSIIQKGLGAITAKERQEIYSRWLGTAPPDKTVTLDLTEEERQWLRDHPVIRHSVESNWPPYEFIDQRGQLQGLSADILKLIEQRLDIRFKLVADNSWAQTLEKARSRDIDLISSIVKTSNRDKYLLFSNPYISPTTSIFTRKDSGPIDSMLDLNQRTVAIENQYNLHERLVQDYPQIRLLPVETTAEALKALSYGRVDAYIGNQGSTNWIAEQNVLTNLRVAHTPVELGRASLRFAVRNDWPMLKRLLDKALASISDVEMLEIRRRWLGIGTGAIRLELSNEEKAWLGRHNVIRITGDPNWLPYEALDEQGNYIGIVADHLELIEKKLGIEFEFVPTHTWSESVAKARNGEVDVISETSNSELSALLNFTSPYLSSPVVIVMKDTENYVENIGQIDDRRIAIIKEYGYVSEIRNKYPDLDYRVVDTIQDGLTAVSTGAADALFSTLAQASYHIAELGINNIRIVGKTEFNTRLALGVQKELAPLVPLLNRALASISKGNKQRILDRWVRDKYAVQIDYRRITLVILIATVVLVLSLLWTYSIRRQKERLRLSEERYQSAMEAVSEAVWEWNLATGQRHFSSGFFTRLGYAQDAIPTSQQQWMALLHPDDSKGFETAINRHLSSEDSGASTMCLGYRVRTKDGDYVRVESRGRVVAWDSEGKPTLRRGTLRDITAQHQAIEALQEKEWRLERLNKRFSLAAQAVSLGVWEYNMDGSDRMWLDDRLYEMYGIDKQDFMLLKDWLQYVHPEDRPVLMELVEKVIRDGGDAHLDFRAFHSDGRPLYIYSGFTAIKGEDGEPDQLIGVNWDITDRKQAEEQFEKLLSALPVSVVIAGQEGKILLANPEAQREFGAERLVVGMQTTDFYADKGQRTEILEQVRQHGQVLGKEVRFQTSSGDILEGLLSAIPIMFDAQPALLGVIVNITERRKMERALAQAKAQAEEANRFKSRFLANMSHEIRTPMNAIVGFGHLLNRTPLTPKQQDYLGKIQVSAQSLLNLIDDILDFSKIEAGQLHIESIDFDLNEVLDNIATLAGTQLAESPVEFVYDIDPALPPRLRGDPHRLTQILTNLVSNAVKFTDQGGIVVSVRMLEEAEQIELLFAVEDTGIGIAPDKIEKLFAPFIQADGSTTREYGGTGLGLSICRLLTELMGGAISAQSKLGAGSRFEFRLPFSVSSSTKPVRLRPDTTHIRILLVDDNAIARQVLVDLLLSLSFRVDVVASGAAAIEKLHANIKTYDVLLLDWRMPGMDGFETVRRIRAADLERQPRIIMMTAYGREAIEQALDLSGIDGFLVKPITSSHLLDAIAQAVEPQPASGADSAKPQPHEHDLQLLQGHVLLVEDNLINQQVAQELLKQMGLEVSVCGSGRQALALLEQAGIDLVLMDIQMPDIDGYETTRAIRRMPGMASLPIIAMTANAMAGDAERSIESGMNGHISKPVDPVMLHTTLKAWLEGAEQGQATPQSSFAGATPIGKRPDLMPHTGLMESQATALAGSPPSLSPIDYNQGVQRIGGNRVLYSKLLKDFATQYHDALLRLETFHQHNNMIEIERLTHTLKGVAGNIGAEMVQQAAAELERQVRLGDADAVGFGFPKLKLALDAALDAAHRFVNGSRISADLATEHTEDMLDTDPADALCKLARLLDSGDAEALNQLAKLPVSRFNDDARLLVINLREQVRSYDFTTAQETLMLLAKDLGLDVHD